MARTRYWLAARDVNEKPIIKELSQHKTASPHNTIQGTYHFPNISMTTAKIIAEALNQTYHAGHQEGYSDGWDEGFKYSQLTNPPIHPPKLSPSIETRNSNSKPEPEHAS